MDCLESNNIDIGFGFTIGIDFGGWGIPFLFFWVNGNKVFYCKFCFLCFYISYYLDK